jgi:hypothetical protein
MGSIQPPESWEAKYKLTKAEQEAVIYCQDAINDLLFSQSRNSHTELKSDLEGSSCIKNFNGVHEAIRSFEASLIDVADERLQKIEGLLEDERQLMARVESMQQALTSFGSVHEEIERYTGDIVSKSAALLLQQVAAADCRKTKFTPSTACNEYSNSTMIWIQSLGK